MMKSLLYNNRFYILLTGFILSGIVYLFFQPTNNNWSIQVARLVDVYGFISISYLYVSLLIGPLCYRLPKIPFASHLKHARRAIGVVAFYFALLHTLLSFFGQLGGFHGIAFWDTNFLIAILCGLVVFIILFLMTITSVDYLIALLGFRAWKILHRFIYLGGILLLIHMLMIGTNYSVLSDPIPQITCIALALLLFLEASRIDAWLRKFVDFPRFGFVTTVIIVSVSVAYFTIVAPFTSGNSSISFDVHSAHRALAEQAVQKQEFAVDISKIPGLDGDKNKRYTVSMAIDPQNPEPNQDVTIRFRVFDAASGNRVSFYKFIYAKQMHVIVVNSALTYFNHLHPTQDGQDFVLTMQFPQADVYHIYSEFQPYGGIEQQVAFTIPVGNPTHIASSQQKSDGNTATKTFGQYEVTLDTHGALSAPAMSFGSQEISFTVRDKRTKKPITTLKPYLASFGHLTMINEKTYEFIHVHPYSLIVPAPDANGGPTVDFLPIGIYGPFSPGTYRVFVELNPNGSLFTGDFTVTVGK